MPPTSKLAVCSKSKKLQRVLGGVWVITRNQMRRYGKPIFVKIDDPYCVFQFTEYSASNKVWDLCLREGTTGPSTCWWEHDRHGSTGMDSHGLPKLGNLFNWGGHSLSIESCAVPAVVSTDRVCFTYNEAHHVFVPWGYNRQLNILKK